MLSPRLIKEERKCRYCNLVEAKDEERFLLKCPMYSEECLSLYFNSMVLKVSAMSQGDVFLFTSHLPTFVLGRLYKTHNNYPFGF